MLEQAVIDLLSSIDYYRSQTPEVSLFYDFFHDQDPTDLSYYLLIRQQAEKELAL